MAQYRHSTSTVLWRQISAFPLTSIIGNSYRETRCYFPTERSRIGNARQTSETGLNGFMRFVLILLDGARPSLSLRQGRRKEPDWLLGMRCHWNRLQKEVKPVDIGWNPHGSLTSYCFRDWRNRVSWKCIFVQLEMHWLYFSQIRSTFITKGLGAIYTLPQNIFVLKQSFYVSWFCQFVTYEHMYLFAESLKYSYLKKTLKL